MPCASLRLCAPTCPDAPELFEQPVPMPVAVPMPMPITVHVPLPRDATVATPASSPMPAQWFVCVCFVGLRKLLGLEKVHSGMLLLEYSQIRPPGRDHFYKRRGHGT